MEILLALSFGAGLTLGTAVALGTYHSVRLFYRVCPYLLKNHPISKNQTQQIIIIAGATDGIGLEYLKHFSAANFNVLALGRNEGKLENVKLISKGVQSIKIDFSQHFTTDDVNILTNQVDRLLKTKNEQFTIRGIVNCVGQAHFSQYKNQSWENIARINSTNINSVHILTKLALDFRSRQPNEGLFFINLSSTVANHPYKYSSLYSASKAYLSNFIQVLSEEEKNITFLDVKPWYVKTKMVGFQDTWDTVDPKTVVEGSLKVLGRRRQCSGCLKHQLINYFQWLIHPIVSRRLEQVMLRLQKIQKLRNRKK